MARFSSLLVVLFFVVLTAQAKAEPLTSFEVTDKPQLASVRIEAPEDDVPLCMVFPSKQGECEGLDTSAMLAEINSKLPPVSRLIALAFIRFEDHAVVAYLTRMHHTVSDMTEPRLEGFIRGIVEPASKDPNIRFLQTPRRTKVGELEALDYATEMAVGDISLHSRTTAVFASDRIHQFSFFAPSTRAASAKKVERHVLGTLRYEPGDLGRFGEPNEVSSAYHLGLWLGRLAIPGCFVLTFLIVAVVHLLKKRKGSTSTG